MSEKGNNFDEKEVDTGAGVNYPGNVNNTESVVPTPPASVAGDQVSLEQQQQDYTAVNMPPQQQDQAYANGYNPDYQNSGYGAGGLFSLPAALGFATAPVYVRIQEDPEEQASKRKIAYIQIGISLFIVFCIFILPNLAGPSMGFGANHVLVTKCNVTFEDVQGCDEVKSQLQKIVKFLKDPTDFEKFGARMPRGYLLAGPPGVGKTMLAKAVAGEAKVPFLAISGAEFEELYVGLGASRVRSLFKDARKFGKAVIFIDEIDAIAGKRNNSPFESSTARQTLNQLLVEMDGFKTGSGVVVLAATNTPDTLDPAILRPGRLDKVFKLSPPDINGRADILKTLIKAIPENMREEGDLKKSEVMWLARITVGYTGADLTNLVNHAKMLASDENSTCITKAHFYKAKEFVDLGPERKLAMTDEDRIRVAYHEAGHAIIALVNQMDCKEYAVEYATIVPHGDALGLVTNVPQRDLNHMSLEMLKHQMDMGLGGFMAEKRYFSKSSADTSSIDKVSTGAASDLKLVNAIARHIVASGFGEKTGFLQASNPHCSSEDFKIKFEEDMKKFMEESKKRVEKLLEKYDVAWRALAEALLKEKSLNREQIEKIFSDKKPKTP